ASRASERTPRGTPIARRTVALPWRAACAAGSAAAGGSTSAATVARRQYSSMPIAASTSRRRSSSIDVAPQLDEIPVERGENPVAGRAECGDRAVQRRVRGGFLRLVFLQHQRLALVLLDAHLEGDADHEALAVADPLVAADRAVHAQRRRARRQAVGD